MLNIRFLLKRPFQGYFYFLRLIENQTEEIWLLQDNFSHNPELPPCWVGVVLETKCLVLFNFLTLRTNGVMILGQVVGMLLVRRLGEDRFLPQIGSQIGIGLCNGSVGGLSCNERRKL